MRKDENGQTCPETLGEYADLVNALAPDSHAAEIMEGLIHKHTRDEKVVAPDSQMRALLMPALVMPRKDNLHNKILGTTVLDWGDIKTPEERLATPSTKAPESLWKKHKAFLDAYDGEENPNSVRGFLLSKQIGYDEEQLAATFPHEYTSLTNAYRMFEAGRRYGWQEAREENA